MTPEKNARLSIDALLAQMGRRGCILADTNIHLALALSQSPLSKAFWGSGG